MGPAYASPAIPSEGYELPLCWDVVSAHWVLTSHFQLIHGTAEHHFGLASEARCLPGGTIQSGSNGTCSSMWLPSAEVFFFKEAD